MPRLRRPAFSMTSLLVLIGLFLLFLAMLFPLLRQVHTQAGLTRSMNNLRQLGIAVHNFHDVNNTMPPTVGKSRVATGTLHFHILPYVEQEAIYRKGMEDWTRIADVRIATFLDPDDKRAPEGNIHQGWLATTNYVGNWLVFRDGGTQLAAIPDGTSNTIMFTTRYQLCDGEPTAWAYNRLHYKAPMFGFYSRARFQLMPGAAECDPSLPQSLTGHGILVGMADGSVRVVSALCSPQTWSYASDPSDGMALPDEFNN